ncbi:MAG: NTP transferase domain-containing protein [Treponema sp.]|jgi:spore coat polysaccharide biosynthesis protein SpsF|nr:NTP transferase domain-containing protein [Treponema sp.]
MTIAIVLQARLDSTRLPNKALLPLRGATDEEPLIYRVMDALRSVPCDLYVLACPPDCVSAFAPFAERSSFEICAGSKEDVLARYCGAVRAFAIDRVIRATGDNPFVFADAALALNREAQSLNADYAGYAALPYGAGVESVAAEALLRAEREASADAEREHVCPYLYNHPERFRLHRPLAPRIWQAPDMRITVDTKEDYERASALYRDLSLIKREERFNGASVVKTYKMRFGTAERRLG